MSAWTDYRQVTTNPLQPLAVTYFSTVTGLSAFQQNNINNFITAITAAGLLGNLIDACFLRADQNTGTSSPRTLRLATGTITGSVVWTQDGIYFGGATQSAKFTVASPSQTNSLVVDLQGDPVSNANAMPISMQNNAGATTAVQGVQLNGTPGQLYTRQGGTATYANGTLAPGGTDGQPTYMGQYISLPAIWGVNYTDAATPTYNAYVDGLLALTTATGGTRSTSSLDTVLLGAFDTVGTFQWQGKVASWALFNKALSAGEHVLVMQALRKLDVRPINMIFMGDSLTATFADSTRSGQNYPQQFSRSPQFSRSARLVNMGSNGTSADYGDTTFASRITPFCPSAGSVDTAWLYVLYGTAGIITGRTAAQEWASLQSIYAKARAAGVSRIIAVANPRAKVDGVLWTNAMQAEWVTLVASIVGGTLLFDELLRFDQVFTPSQAGVNPWYVDVVHQNPAGDAYLANYVATGQIQPGGTAYCGAFQTNYVAVTATYSILTTDSTIDATSGTFTATLPTAVGVQGQIYRVKNSGAGTVTLATTGGQTIDGSATKLIATTTSLTVQSNGANWIVI